MRRLLTTFALALALLSGTAWSARQYIPELRVKDLQLQAWNSCADTASSGTVSVGSTAACNVVTFTGGTQINTINTCDSDRKGRPLHIICGSSVPFGDGTGNIQLAEAFTCSAGVILSLLCDGTDWIETSRTGAVGEGGGGGDPGDALNYYNVQDYGAVGDGATDDTLAIQEAVAEMLLDDLDGSTLYFPAGNYMIGASTGTDDRIVIGAHSNYTIRGEGATITIDGLLNGTSSGAIFSITSPTNLTISGLRLIDPDSATHSGAEQTHGIVINSGTNVTIHNVYVEGMGDECIDVYNSANVTIRDSYFKDCVEVDTASAGQVGIGSSFNVQVLNNTFEDTSPAAAGQGTLATAAAIQVSCAVGACASDQLYDIRIADNTILDPNGIGILVNPADGVLTGLVIDNNTIRSPARSGIRMIGFNDGTAILRSHITNNRIIGGGEDFDGSTGAGIYVSQITSDGEGLIAHNTVSAWGDTDDDDEHRGIYVTSGGWLIVDNLVKSARVAGIQSTTSLDPNLIANNRVETVNGSGIFSTSSDVVRDNVVIDAATCIYVNGGAPPGIVAGNTLDTCSTTGIRLNAAAGEAFWATGNTIIDSLVGITGSGTDPNYPHEANNIFIDNTANYAGSFSTAMRFGPVLDLAQDFKAFGVNDATPSVANGVLFQTANTGATTITNFDDGEAGQVIMIRFNDNFTTLDFTGNPPDTYLKGGGGVDWSPVQHDSMICFRGATHWFCTPSAGNVSSQVEVNSGGRVAAVSVDDSPEIEWTEVSGSLKASFAAPVTHEYGGLEADVSAYAGLVAIDEGATANVTTITQLFGYLAGSIAGDDLTLDGSHNLNVDPVFIRNDGDNVGETDALDGDLEVMGSSGATPTVTAHCDIGTGDVCYRSSTATAADSDVVHYEARESSGTTNDVVFRVDGLGVTYSKGGFSSDPTAVPEYGWFDSDLLGADKTAASMTANCTTLTDAGEVCDWAINQMGAGTPGTLAPALSGDGSAGQILVHEAMLVTGTGTIAATTAAALAANGGNCGAGEYPLGVDASGAVESCTDATTEINSAIATHAADSDAHQLPPPLCFYIEDPVTDEDLFSVWRANQAITVTEIWCEVEGGTSVGVDVGNDDGTPAGVNGSDITCTTSGVSDTSFAGDTTFGDGDRMDVNVGTVTGAVTRLTVCVEYSVD